MCSGGDKALLLSGSWRTRTSRLGDIGRALSCIIYRYTATYLGPSHEKIIMNGMLSFSAGLMTW